MDNFWLQKAHQYINEHGSFCNVRDVCIAADGVSAVICADVFVGLPGRFVEDGVTASGIKSLEPVKFVFANDFPLKAPEIILREDFPRSFPHINPSQKEILPCIFSGDISELLQQSEWMNGVLNQLVDWLEKAASGSLINYDQGWEPMRNDSAAGFISYDVFELLDFLKDSAVGSRAISFEVSDNFIFADSHTELRKGTVSTLVVCQHPNKLIQKCYIPNSIQTLMDLYAFSNTIGITDLNKIIEYYDAIHSDQDKMFVTLAIHRPCKLINSDDTVEVLNFVIHKSKHRKGKKRVLPGCSVGMLAHINKTSRKLLKKLSGSKHDLNQMAPISLLGCGSLGSKIGLHLTRSGNGPFQCIDNDIFLPHNNARHALSFTFRANKAIQLAMAINSISGCLPNTSTASAIETDFSKSRAIIDTTASLSVRSLLMMDKSLSPIISCGIYGGGSLGVTLIESAAKGTKLDDLWAALYYQCLEHVWLREIIFTEQKENVAIGQGCGSHTVIMSDATLSLFASSMSLMIQKMLESSFPQTGLLILTRIQNEIDLVSEKVEIDGAIDVQSIMEKNWNVRILNHVVNKMKVQAIAAGHIETGGCLIGSVFLNAKSIIITDILPPPADSIASSTKFILGKEGLEQKIKLIERKTNGKVTYLGTWHSHPLGGGASSTDQSTITRLLFIRNYEPTVCLIWTPKGIIQV